MTDVILETRNLKKSFGKLEVLKGISTGIRRGEVVSIIGPPGGGKSTFLRCLNLLETPDGGQVLFKGQDITDKKLNISQYRQSIGMVFQHFNVFPNLTVLENVELPLIYQGVNADDRRIAMTEIIFWVGRKLSLGGRYYRDGFYWNTRVAYSQLEIVTDNCDPGEEYAVSFRSLSGTFHSDWKMEYMIFSLPAEQREYKPIAPGERITVHKGNGTSVVIFAFSNYEGTKNYNTTDNYFEFTVCDSRGRGRPAVLSTNRDEWLK